MFSRSLVMLSAITITNNSALVLSPHLGRTHINYTCSSFQFFFHVWSFCLLEQFGFRLVSLPRSDEVGHFWGHIMQGLVIAFVL